MYHVYEVIPEMVKVIDKLKHRGISVFNQMVFTFESSRYFEALLLRLLHTYRFKVRGKGICIKKQKPLRI